MLVLRSIPLILPDNQDLRDTLRVFTEVKNLASPIAFNQGGRPLSFFQLNRACYHQLKGRINSQMTCSALKACAASYSAAKKNKHRTKGIFKFKHLSALFSIGDRGRDASFIKNQLSISTVNGRINLDYRIPEAYKSMLNSAVKVNSLTVFIRDNRLQARLTVSLEVQTPVGHKPVGVDLNETNAVVAVGSENQVFFASGRQIKIKNRRSRKTRKRLVAKLASKKAQTKPSTRSIRRLLKRQSRKQSNRSLTFAHTTAKQLCRWAEPGSVLVLEDLQGISRIVSKKQMKKTGKWKPKALRRRISGWNHAKIRELIEQKAPMFGHETQTVNPAYTSLTCNGCGATGDRSRHRFSCGCGNQEHADINAANNIRDRYVVLRHDGVQSETVDQTLSTTPDTSVSRTEGAVSFRTEARSGRRKASVSRASPQPSAEGS